MNHHDAPAARQFRVQNMKEKKSHRVKHDWEEESDKKERRRIRNRGK